MAIDTGRILFRPLLTEKSAFLKEDCHQYSFEVHPGATKGQIAQAVEDVFKVRVTRVRTLKTHGKIRRTGRFVGQRPDSKKAIVTVPKDQKIDFEKV